MTSRVHGVSQELLIPGVIEERLMADAPTRFSRHLVVENPFSIEGDIANAVRYFGFTNSVELIRSGIKMCASQKANVGIGIGLLSVVGSEDSLDSNIYDLLTQTKTGFFGKFGKTEKIIKEAANLDSESYLQYDRYTPLAQALDTRYVLNNTEVHGRFAVIGLQKSLDTISHIRDCIS